MTTNNGYTNKQKGTFFEYLTQNALETSGMHISDSSERVLCDEFGRNTEIDRILFDKDGWTYAILEIKSGQFNDVDQVKRLTSLANQQGYKLIFATPDGTTNKFSQSVKKELDKSQVFVIDPQNLTKASNPNSSGINLGLPPELWNTVTAWQEETNTNTSRIKWHNSSNITADQRNEEQKSRDISITNSSSASTQPQVSINRKNIRRLTR